RRGAAARVARHTHTAPDGQVKKDNFSLKQPRLPLCAYAQNTKHFWVLCKIIKHRKLVLHKTLHKTLWRGPKKSLRNLKIPVRGPVVWPRERLKNRPKEA